MIKILMEKIKRIQIEIDKFRINTAKPDDIKRYFNNREVELEEVKINRIDDDYGSVIFIAKKKYLEKIKFILEDLKLKGLDQTEPKILEV
jgi:hypothetical protein